MAQKKMLINVNIVNGFKKRQVTVSVFFYGDIDRLKFFILIMHNIAKFIANEKMNVLLVLLLVKVC